jgi:hypothetical protein
VTATLTEFSITPEPASAEAGSVTIKANNVGALTHELVLVRGDPADLPTDSDGAVDEDAFESAGVEAIGEVEDVESGTSKDLTADLEAGTYVVFCNIVETGLEAAVESHFAEGMVATLVVN